MSTPYSRAIILFGGFTQRYGRAGNGMYRLFDRLYRAHAGPATLIEYFPWFVGPAGIAEALAQLDAECRALQGRRLAIQIAGFSFGGQTAADVCWHLQNVAVYVEQLQLCDAVSRRWRFWPFSAFNPLAEIELPVNVRNLTWFVQRNAYVRTKPPFLLPRGHRVVPAVTTAVSGPHVLDAPHDEIDGHQAFHEAVLYDARMLHRPETEPPAIAGSIAEEMSRRTG